MEIYDISLHDYLDHFMTRRKEDKWIRQKIEKKFDLIGSSSFFVDIPVRLEMLRKIVNALRFLHKNNIFHLDLKPSNIMMNLNKAKGKVFNLKFFSYKKAATRPHRNE